MRYDRVIPLLTSGLISLVLLLWTLGAFAVDPQYVGPVGAVNAGKPGEVPDVPFWNGYDYAVVVTFDDGFENQVAVRDVLDSLGVKSTIYLCQEDMGTSSGMTWAEADSFRIMGHEIGSTGRRHYALSGGLMHFDTDVEAQRDSMAWIVSPSWVDSAFYGGVATCESYAQDGIFASWPSTQIVKNTGYTSMRGLWNTSGPSGWISTKNGKAQWDGWRALNPEITSSLYGYSIELTEALPTNYDSASSTAIFKTTAWTPPDSVQLRAAAAFAYSAANGNAPIVLIFHGQLSRSLDFPSFYSYVKANYNVGFFTAKQISSIIRSKRTAVTAPGWAPYAQLAEIDADSACFYGGVVASLTAATDTFVFQAATTTSLDTVLGGAIPASWVVATGGHTDALLDVSLPTADPPWSGSANVLGYAGPPPCDTGTEAIPMFNFDIAETLSTRQVVKAEIGFWSWQASFDHGTQEMDFTAVVGVNDTTLQSGWDDARQNYSHSNKDGTVAWTNSIDSYFLTAFSGTSGKDTKYPGTIIYALADSVVGGEDAFRVLDVTEYIQQVKSEGLPCATFWFWGQKSNNELFGTESMDRAAPEVHKAPYLYVETAD